MSGFCTEYAMYSKYRFWNAQHVRTSRAFLLLWTNKSRIVVLQAQTVQWRATNDGWATSNVHWRIFNTNKVVGYGGTSVYLDSRTAQINTQTRMANGERTNTHTHTYRYERMRLGSAPSNHSTHVHVIPVRYICAFGFCAETHIIFPFVRDWYGNSECQPLAHASEEYNTFVTEPYGCLTRTHARSRFAH